MVRITPIYKPFSRFGRGITLLRGLTITMVINHVLNGMILQVFVYKETAVCKILIPSSSGRLTKIPPKMVVIWWLFKGTRWWFRMFFMFIPAWGDDAIWRAYCSMGLKPPTKGIFSIFPNVWSSLVSGKVGGCIWNMFRIESRASSSQTTRFLCWTYPLTQW